MLIHVNQVHRAALAPITAGDLAVELGDHRLEVAALGEISRMATIRAGDYVVRSHRVADANRDRLEIRGLLVEGDKGNAARGRPLFKETCAICHKLFDEGEPIGPDLTGTERGNLDFLLTSLVDPSALIRKERPYLQCIQEHYEAIRSRLNPPPGAVLLGQATDFRRSHRLSSHTRHSIRVRKCVCESSQEVG